MPDHDRSARSARHFAAMEVASKINAVNGIGYHHA